MRVTVIGKTGQVATELQRRVPEGVSLTIFGRDRVDLTKPKQAACVIGEQRSDIVINAAAYTAVDRAEEEPDLAHTVNTEAPGALARSLAAKEIPFVHISTDYVFDGAGETAFSPDDRVGPLGVYGASKLEGENAVRAAGGSHIILRTSWVFSAHGANFVKTMLRLGRERDLVHVVSDQIGGPTPATAIADACYALASALNRGEPSGTHHFAGTPDVSWADFAREIFQQASLECSVEDISTAEYPTPARRPLNSRLDCRSLERYGIRRPDWRAGLADVLKELE